MLSLNSWFVCFGHWGTEFPYHTSQIRGWGELHTGSECPWPHCVKALLCCVRGPQGAQPHWWCAAPLTELNPKQHVPLEEYAANLKSMVQYLKSVDITADRIILITPPPLQESAWEKACLAKGKAMMRMGGISAFYQGSVSGDFLRVCAILQSCFLTCWKSAAVLLNSVWINSWSNCHVITNILSKVLIDLLMHRTDRSGCPLRTWCFSTCPKQVP